MNSPNSDPDLVDRVRYADFVLTAFPLPYRTIA